jgi:O-antigen ligase
MVAAVWAVGSRSGSVIVAVEIGAVILLTVRSAPLKRYTRRRAILVAAPAAVLIAGIGWQGLAARSTEASHDEMRPAFMASTIEMIKARPLRGFGLGTWETVYPAFATIDPGLYVEHAHNDWLEWAADGGVPFAGVMLGLAVFAFRRALGEPWCLGIFAVFVQSIVDFPLHKPALLGFVCAGLGYLAAHQPVVVSLTSTKSSITSAKLA